MKHYIRGFLVFLVTGFIFWYSGNDISARGVEQGLSLAMSILFGCAAFFASKVISDDY